MARIPMLPCRKITEAPCCGIRACSDTACPVASAGHGKASQAPVKALESSTIRLRRRDKRGKLAGRSVSASFSRSLLSLCLLSLYLSLSLSLSHSSSLFLHGVLLLVCMSQCLCEHVARPRMTSDDHAKPYLSRIVDPVSAL